MQIYIIFTKETKKCLEISTISSNSISGESTLYREVLEKVLKLRGESEVLQEKKRANTPKARPTGYYS